MNIFIPLREVYQRKRKDLGLMYDAYEEGYMGRGTRERWGLGREGVSENREKDFRS